MTIVAELGKQIREGKIAPGSALPSIPQLEEQYEATTGVVRRALQALRQEHLVRTDPGVGSFVTDPETWTSSEAAELMQLVAALRDEVREVRDRLDSIERRLT